jgi:transposase
MHYVAFSMLWFADDPGSDGRVSVARDRLHGHAPRLSVVVTPGAGGAAQDPLSGHLFVFRGRRSDLVKLIWHDGQGACLFTKRLERGRFIWPSVAGEAVTISSAQLSYLLSGIDWRTPQETQRPTQVG